MVWKKDLIDKKEPETHLINSSDEKHSTNNSNILKAQRHEEECVTFIYDNLALFVETSNDLDQVLHKIARINPTLGFDWVDQFVTNLPKFSKEWTNLYSERKHYNDLTHKRDIDGNLQRSRWDAISQPYWQRRYDLFCKYGHDNTYDILFEERMLIKEKGWETLKEIKQ